jgi:hypothetical protein
MGAVIFDVRSAELPDLVGCGDRPGMLIQLCRGTDAAMIVGAGELVGEPACERGFCEDELAGDGVRSGRAGRRAVPGRDRGVADLAAHVVRVNIGDDRPVIAEVDEHAQYEAAEYAFGRGPPVAFAFFDIDKLRNERHAVLGEARAVKYSLPEFKGVPADAGGAPAEGGDLQEGFLPCVRGDLDVTGDLVLKLAGGGRRRLMATNPAVFSSLSPLAVPVEPDWGTMLSNGLNYLFDGYWWLVYPPAIILIVTVVAFNLIGDAIRDSLDVRLQRP